MFTVEEALARILAQAASLPVERVSLLQAGGRVLAEDVYADMDVPPFANSAVDGYAVRAEDTAGASPFAPIVLRTLRDIAAGVVPTETITTGMATRIMTGAMLPPGADAVVMVEDTRPAQNPDDVMILEAARQGQHCRPAGQDVARGDLVLPSGTWLRAAAIGMLATLGKATVDTIRPPRVAIVSTGDEVVDVVNGALPPPGKIRNSNLYALAALVQETGATLHSLTHIPDEQEATETALRRCAGLDDNGNQMAEGGADVIVTAGGVSVGDRDYVKPALEKLGTLDLWRVSMKPGKPLAFGRIGNALFFGLPGNPVSAHVTFELFARPALWKMAGREESELARRTVTVKVEEAISHTLGRREYVRAFVTPEGKGGGFMARTTGAQESNRLRSLLQANALLVVPEESEGVDAGDVLQALLLD